MGEEKEQGRKGWWEVVVRNKAPGTKIRDFLGEGCDSFCELELGRSAPQPLPMGGE